MGQLLSVPLKIQLISQCRTDLFAITGVEMQGYRTNMEDELIIQVDLRDGIHLVVVFDGHGGTGAAAFLKEHFVATLRAQKTLDISLALCTLDQRFKATHPTDRSGCTVAGVIFDAVEALLFHAGDARVVIYDENTQAIIHQTVDHKATNKEEQQRICAAGGHVERDRVNGDLAPSRAFGDHQYKDRADLPWTAQKVTVEPVCSTLQLRDSYRILVLCDGPVERLTNEDLVSHAYACGMQHKHREDSEQEEQEEGVDVVRSLIQFALSSGSQDNMSIALIARHGGGGGAQQPRALTHWFVDDDDVTWTDAKDNWILAKRTFLEKRKHLATNYEAMLVALTQLIQRKLQAEDEASKPSFPSNTRTSSSTNASLAPAQVHSLDDDECDPVPVVEAYTPAADSL